MTLEKRTETLTSLGGSKGDVEKKMHLDKYLKSGRPWWCGACLGASCRLISHLCQGARLVSRFPPLVIHQSPHDHRELDRAAQFRT